MKKRLLFATIKNRRRICLKFVLRYRVDAAAKAAGVGISTARLNRALIRTGDALPDMFFN